MTILSTKILNAKQKALLLNSGISLVEYNAISIEFVPFNAPLNMENAIFTSQNAVLSVQDSGLQIQNCFCVGEKTKALLVKSGYKVVKMTEYASELSEYLMNNHKSESFHFFCGNIRSDVIPSVLKKNNISFEEIEVYKTTLRPKKFERQFDVIMFFSPSGVKSFHEKNDPSEVHSIVVCIGTTTASEAKKYSEKVVISNSTTVESVIAKTVKILMRPNRF